MKRLILCCLLLVAATESSTAQTAPGPDLPTFARSPQTDADAASPWKGLYAGAQISAAFGGHGGHIGGGGFIGYDKVFDNNLVLGVQANAGYAPALFPHGSFAGYDYASANLKVGYEIGRLTPYVTVGAGLAKANAPWQGTFSSTGDSLNNLFSSPSNPGAFTSLGAGVDYKINDNLTVGVGVSANQGAGFHAP